jgi:hypothetical protein
VTDDEHGATLVERRLAHFAEALLLKLQITHGEHFVDDQDVGLQMRRDREGEPYVHAARIPLHRGVEEALDLGEGDDLVEFAADLRARHAEDRAIQIDVLATGQFGMKPGAHLE